MPLSIVARCLALKSDWSCVSAMPFQSGKEFTYGSIKMKSNGCYLKATWEKRSVISATNGTHFSVT